MEKIHEISPGHLTLNKVSEIIRHNYKLKLGDDSRERIIRCRKYLDKKMTESETPIYGVTTGFGSLCNINIGKDQLSQLQINLMMSHACGCGDRVPNEIVKLMILLKIQSLSYGYSACKLDTVERLIDFFNEDVYPIVYMQGSVGSSGDLVPLAHLCLPLLGLGEVEYQGKRMSGAELLKLKGWKPITLASKEGLALLNGTQNMAAFCCWSIIQATKLSNWADYIAALSLDAYEGLVEPFNRAVHVVRPHKGQLDTAANISERRIYKLVSGTRGLPSFLVANPGVNSGFMITQYTAASIVSQSKGLCMPASVDSIPTPQGQEDHVSMGANAGTKLYQVVLNTERVLAIELFNAAQALDFRRPLKTSPILERLVADYREVVPFIDKDVVMYPYIAQTVDFLRNKKMESLNKAL